MIQLRDYQIDMVDRVRSALRGNSRVILQSPTGSGKTALACHMMGEASRRGKSSFFLVHQNELLKQTSRALWHNKIPHGMIVSGKMRSPLSVQVASVMTLRNRLNHYNDPDLIIIDESHRAMANSYRMIIDAYPGAKVVGLTATPQRTDGKGLGDLFDDIVEGPSIRYLIERGYLCDYELYGVPVDIDVSGVRTRGGDYDQKQLEAAANQKAITGDAVQHYKKFAGDKLCVVMCVSVKHAEDVAQAYRDAGIPSAAIHGKSKDRDQILEDFESHKIRVLTSVQLLIEGVDLPEIGCVQFLRPTQSLVVFMQGIGRGLRPHENKDKLIILDHVGNFTRHGMPCQQREWSLEGRTKKSRVNDEPNINIQTCKNCYFTFLAGVSVCPGCGAPVPVQERKLEIIDGELARIEKAAIKAKETRERKQEQGQARNIPDLVAIGVRRGMKNPTGWAVNVFSARQGRRPSPSDWSIARSAYAELRA